MASVLSLSAAMPTKSQRGMIAEPGSAWEECEAALDRRGTPLPLFHRALWARASKTAGIDCWFIPIRAPDGTCKAGFAVEGGRSRALPGHRLLSVRQLGIGSGGLDEASLDAGLAMLADRARSDHSVLRVTVESFAVEADDRQRTAELLRRYGFLQTPTTRTYQRTLLLDLRPEQETIFAGLHKNARQGIRNVARYPVVVKTAESGSIASRLEQLAEQAHQRTGGEPRRLDWDSLIRLSQKAPELSRIAILERTDRSGPESVLAFAWGCVHGNVGQYSESGSVRASDLKVSTSYALLWDLILWARSKGAHWFDLGGITGGTTHSDDALGGISDFKRRFSQREVEVGGQWELEPHPTRAAAARFISRSARVLRQTAKTIGKQRRGGR